MFRVSTVLILTKLKLATPVLVAILLVTSATFLSAAEYRFDGNWQGKGYTSGADDCPSFDIYMSIAGDSAVGRFKQGTHTVELSFDLDDLGEFSGSFTTTSNHIVRISGKFDGNKLKGYLHHAVCRGSWYAKRVPETSPASKPSQTATASQAQATRDLSLVEQLQVLQDLQQKNLIDQTTYERRRNALLNVMLGATVGDEQLESPATEEQIAAKDPRALPGDLDVGPYYALIVANNNYRHFPKLSSATSDGVALAKVLRDRYGFEVDLLIDANRRDIISALTRYRGKLRYRDNLLIYYAGHGILDEGAGEGYWIPVDGERRNPANWVANADVTSAIRAMRAKHIMLIVGSCYSGTLTRGAEADLPRSEDRYAWYKRAAKKVGRTVLTSGGLEPVLDSGGGKHSVFAKAFLQVLRENKDVMDGQTVFARIKRPVVVNASQTPEYSDIRFTGHDGGDFLFIAE